jgi:hypothetical protein
MTSEEKIELYNRLFNLSIEQIKQFVSQETNPEVKAYAENELSARIRRAEDLKNGRW